MVTGCSSSNGSSSGLRCDVCGRKASITYAGHPMCSKCYQKMNEVWDENHGDLEPGF